MKIELRRPDDWHIHLRDGATLAAVLPATAAHFARAIVMPNLLPPVTTAADALAYRQRILAALPPGSRFAPLMTCYLTDATDAEDLALGFQSGAFAAAKLYPAGATTNSAAGVTDIRKLDGILERMERIAMPLLIHGEVVDTTVDIFDREAVFLDRVLIPLLGRHPALRVVLEHLSTATAVKFVIDTHYDVGATITAHHLVISRNDILVGGIRPHLYCLPIAKRESDRLALRRAATSGHPRFFLGTDSAPHPAHEKESACGCAGIYTAPVALAVYAQVFDEEGALDKLEAFTSLNGPRFYRLPVNDDRITLTRDAWRAALTVEIPGGRIAVFGADSPLAWRVAAD